MGKRYDVPESLTIQKAIEYAGYQLVRGCGCRGGICGACGTVYRFPDSYRIEVGLACQTVVQPDMYIAQIPFFPGNKAVYDIEKLRPTGATIAALYPEIFKCVGCGTCTRSCPMDIDVMGYISKAHPGRHRGRGRELLRLRHVRALRPPLPGRESPVQRRHPGPPALCAPYRAQAKHLAKAVENIEDKEFDKAIKD